MSADDPFVGATIDRWRVIAPLGQGGIGKVYRAEAADGSGHGKNVALKVLQSELAADDQSKERFQREARALNGLQHPNIVEVLDYGIAHGAPYLVMELLDGMPLDAYIEKHHPPPRLALELGKDVLSGLAFAHSLGVVHRDMKTENVFVVRAFDGRYRAKLLDFGLAKFVDEERWGTDKKLTAFGTVMGSPAYMPPEQALGGKADTRSDVYSSGVILFELLTGAWPFMAETQSEMLKLHLTAPVPPVSSIKPGIEVPGEIDAIISKALAKESPQRFANAQQMLEALEQVIQRMPAAAPTQAAPMMGSMPAQVHLPPAASDRPPWLVPLFIVGGLVGLAMVLVLVVSIVLGVLQ
jgi:eukaryotic-like serine/threonine-protein kinase